MRKQGAGTRYLCDGFLDAFDEGKGDIINVRQFSVLVIAHGRTEHLRALLAGVTRAAERPCEVVLVYMDDPTPEPVQCSVPLRILHVSGHAHELGLPLARARNAAAAAARCPSLVFLDVDCIASAGLFTELMDAIVEEPVLAMAEPRYLRAPLRSGEEVDDASLLAASVPHHSREGLAASGTGEHHEMFWSLGFAIKAELFAQLGGFDTEFSGYGAEDTDLAFRARAAGVKMRFVAEMVFHQHHGVHRPPLNHFWAIIANAKTFRHRWDVWPMEGWLGAFADLGLITWEKNREGLDVLREPTAAEIVAARISAPY